MIEGRGRVVRRHYMVDGDDMAADIVSDILHDVTDRRGWRQAWDTFDPDIQRRIIAEWLHLVRERLTTPGAEP